MFSDREESAWVLEDDYSDDDFERAKKLVKDMASVKKPTEIEEIKQQLDKMPIDEDPFDNNKDSFKSYNFDKSGNSKKNHNLASPSSTSEDFGGYKPSLLKDKVPPRDEN